jgi:hypothetical protein
MLGTSQSTKLTVYQTLKEFSPTTVVGPDSIWGEEQERRREGKKRAMETLFPLCAQNPLYW